MFKQFSISKYAAGMCCLFLGWCCHISTINMSNWSKILRRYVFCPRRECLVRLAVCSDAPHRSTGIFVNPGGGHNITLSNNIKSPPDWTGSHSTKSTGLQQKCSLRHQQETEPRGARPSLLLIKTRRSTGAYKNIYIEKEKRSLIIIFF